MHWIADCICAHRLADVDTVQGFMDAVMDELGLHRIDGYVHTFNNGGSVYGPGISAPTLIAESHIQLHTAPERSLLQLKPLPDVSSCRHRLEARHVDGNLNGDRDARSDCAERNRYDRSSVR